MQSEHAQLRQSRGQIIPRRSAPPSRSANGGVGTGALDMFVYQPGWGKHKERHFITLGIAATVVE